MNIELIAYTQGNPKTYNYAGPTDVCALAASQCYDSEPSKTKVKVCIAQGHESIIEHASFTFLFEGVSRAFLAQITRHRMASYSVRSQRYCGEENFDYEQPPTIFEHPEDDVVDAYHAFMEQCSKAYKYFRDKGIPKEAARFVLPNACTTTMVVTMNARSLRNFFKLRLDKHAQWEIRMVTNRMFDLLLKVAPDLFEDLACKNFVTGEYKLIKEEK